jgi:hypothetical protein
VVEDVAKRAALLFLSPLCLLLRCLPLRSARSVRAWA